MNKIAFSTFLMPCNAPYSFSWRFPMVHASVCRGAGGLRRHLTIFSAPQNGFSHLPSVVATLAPVDNQLSDSVILQQQCVATNTMHVQVLRHHQVQRCVVLGMVSAHEDLASLYPCTAVDSSCAVAQRRGFSSRETVVTIVARDRTMAAIHA